MRRHKKGILRILLFSVVSLILGFNLYQWNAGHLLKNSMPMPFGYGISVILSGSMEPTLHVDDLVLIKESEEYQVGDIIVYQTGGELILHRIISIEGEAVVTQGDANPVADEPIKTADIKGVLVGRIPYAGWLVRQLKKPLASILLLILAFFLMELSYRKDKQRDSANIEEIKAEIHRLRAEQDKYDEEKSSCL